MLVAELNNDFVLNQQDLPPSKSYFPQSQFDLYVVLQHDLNGTVTRIERMPSLSLPFFVRACNRSDFQYWTFAPVFNDIEMALIGEMNKIITVSETRFQSIKDSGLYGGGSGYMVHLQGVPDEEIDISILDIKTNDMKIVTCQFPSSGTTVLHIPDMTCGD